MDFRSLLVIFFLAHISVGALPQLLQVHSKFQYRQTFKGPHLTNSKGLVPFWDYGGSAIPSDDSIRVCPSVKSRRGWVWAKNPLVADNWMVDVSLRVTGRLKTGADGMAIWFTESRGTEGSVYGNTETWKGLAIVLDSFDNDGQHDNPHIQVVLNDGSRQYQHHTDGRSTESGGCVKDFRNRPYPVKIKVVYLRGVIEVWIHEGVSLTDDDYELCAKLENLPELSWIPKNGYWGVTAATGGLSDDHDVLSFITHTLTPIEALGKEESTPPPVDQAKFEQMADQYNQMARDFDQRKDTYQQEHNKEGMVDWQREVEMEQSMRLVADMQTALQRDIRALSQKVDLLITGGGGGVDRARPVEAVSSSLSAEISHIKTTESNILHQLADLRAAMDRSVPEGGKATLSEQLQPIYETKSLVQEQGVAVQNVLTQLKTLAADKCPSDTTSSCLSPWLFLVVMAIQLLLMLGYSIYRQTQERNAKKFF